MAELDPHSPATGQDSPKGTAEPHRNGTADAKSTDSSPNGDTSPPPEGHGDRSGFERAEEIVDHLAEKAASLTAASGRKLLWLFSRSREVAEDFWADVQDFRQGKKP